MEGSFRDYGGVLRGHGGVVERLWRGLDGRDYGEVGMVVTGWDKLMMVGP